MHDPEIPLCRLTDNERRALRLLAQGHTAKSIAAETGATESAINERLREARRKTGVGSSRELARLLRTRENRDEQIGIAPSPPAVAPPIASAAPWWRRRPEVIVMMLMMMAGAALLMNQTAPKIEPIPDAWKVQVGLTPKQRQAHMLEEPRDTDWADRAEPILRTQFATIPHLSSAPQITCRSRTCLVSGPLDASVTQQSFGRIINGLDLKPVEAATALRADSWALEYGGPQKTFSVFFHRGG